MSPSRSVGEGIEHQRREVIGLDNFGGNSQRDDLDGHTPSLIPATSRATVARCCRAPASRMIVSVRPHRQATAIEFRREAGVDVIDDHRIDEAGVDISDPDRGRVMAKRAHHVRGGAAHSLSTDNGAHRNAGDGA